MKFKKVPNVYLFSKFVREDGEFTIESDTIYVNGKYKDCFTVTDREGNIVERMQRLKDAKAKYENA